VVPEVPLKVDRGPRATEAAAAGHAGGDTMTWEVRQGDCVAVLRELPDASVDSCVTDPPYGLEFMGADWDGSDGFRRSLNVADAGRDNAFGRASRTSPEYRAGHLFQDWCEVWAREVLRVLRPGGHLLAAGGTRTYHRMVCAIEDAGFEIRDSLHWVYGSGFPKSLDVSKAIQEATHRTGSWRGWGTALKPSHEPIVLARKPLQGTVAANVIAHGTGGINVEGCRVGWGGEADKASGRPASFAKAHDGFNGEAFKIADRSHRNPVAEQPAAGRWPPNLLLTHAPDCGETCAPGCPVAELDRQSGALTSGERHGPSSADAGRLFGLHGGPCPGDSGGASRFFPVFRYCAKPSRAERDAGLEDVLPTTGGEATERADDSAGTQSPRSGAGRNGGARNFHPTVKPIRLMEWLVRLVTPPGGLVVDPFTGSGTTGCAAVRQGFDFLGVEREEPFVQLAVRRIGLAAGAPRARRLGDLVRLKPAPSVPQLALFDSPAVVPTTPSGSTAPALGRDGGPEGVACIPVTP
jgi:site-specific DNA-methyltransferase (adenine-specific)